MTRTKLALLVVFAVVLAGCSGAGTETTTTATTTEATETPEATTTAPESTTMSSDDEAMDVTGAEVKQAALSAMAAVETYRIRSATSRTLSGNGVDRQISVETTGVFDRSARDLRFDRTTGGPDGAISETIYLVDRALYRHSPSYVEQFGSEWITADLSDGFATRWRSVDTMTRQRATLANATVEVVGTETIDGTEAYVLVADVDEDAQNRYLAGLTGSDRSTIERVNVTYWISTETMLPVQSVSVVESTTAGQGQQVAVTEYALVGFSGYGEPVDVSLPEAAGTAVPIDNATAEGSASVGPDRAQ